MAVPVREITKARIAAQLRSLLAEQDTDLATDGLLNRKRSGEHSDDVEMLIQHVAIVMQYLRMDAAASRREAFALQQILDRDGSRPGGIA